MTSLPSELRDLALAAAEIGGDVRLVQGAGGNLSMKLDGTMWIKASGTRLAQARERQIFVPMDLRLTRADVLVTESLTACIQPDFPGSDLRPSIETALHALLEHKFVVHVHSVGAIASGLSEQGIARLLSHLPGLFVIPYAKPGIELARAVVASGAGEVDPHSVLILLLRNHGVVVGGPTIESVRATIDRIEDLTVVKPPLPAVTGNGARATKGGRILAAGSVGPADRAVLVRGPLTPDSAVFLGPHPFGTEPGSQPGLRIDDDGGVTAMTDLGADELEICLSLVDVARQTLPGDDTTSLLASDVSALVDWEAELWRKKMKR